MHLPRPVLNVFSSTMIWGGCLVSHAFLGQLDVNPLGGIAGGEGAQNELKICEFWAQLRGPGKDGSTVLRIEGKSNAEGRSGDSRRGDGRIWRHDVELAWQGYVEMKQDRMARLLMLAEGSENLEWRNVFQNLHVRADVTQLPAGHSIDLSCGVRYGIIGEPVAADEAGADDAPPQHLPDEARKHVVEALGGGAFLVFRDQVQEELNLSDDQKQKLLATFPEYAQQTKQVFDKIAELKPAEPEKELESHRQKSHESWRCFSRKPSSRTSSSGCGNWSSSSKSPMPSAVPIS
jgi:hypothetical protein